MGSKSIQELENKISEFKNLNEVMEFLRGIPKTDEERIYFYLRAFFEFKNKQIKMELIPTLFNECIDNNPDGYFEVIAGNKELLELFLEYTKTLLYVNQNNANFYKRIFETEIFKNKLLDDFDFVSKQNIDFFGILPSDYIYLIGLYDGKNQRNDKRIFELYKKYYGNVFTDEELKNLAKYHYDLNTGTNMFELSSKNLNLPLSYVLKVIVNNPKKLAEFRLLNEKLDLRIVINFMAKYDDTSIYYSVINNISMLDNDIISKIKYLSTERKLSDTNFDFASVSLGELKSMPKEKAENMGSKLMGGPHSKTQNSVFNDSTRREIRRIDTDGKYFVLPLTSVQDHEDGTRKIYRDKKEIYMALHLSCIERACLAIRHISSITFAIEDEMCYLVMPQKISNEQYERLKEIIKTMTDKGSIAVMSYNPESEESIFANDGSNMNKDEAMEFINNYPHGESMSLKTK